jgi:hypothetical protein
VSAILALRDHNNVAGEEMGAVSTETIPTIERGDVFGPCLERSQSATYRNEICVNDPKILAAQSEKPK